MNKLLPVLTILVFLASSAAAASSAPQSFLDGVPKTKTDLQLYPVTVIAVDGDLQHENPARVTPGPHWLQIAGPANEPRGIPTKPQTFVMKIEPCTHYYLGARKETETSHGWKLVVDQKETVGACDPAEEQKKADANPPGGKTHPPH